MYYSKASWMSTAIFELEVRRLSRFFQMHWPTRKFAVLMDNAPMHICRFEPENLKLISLPKNTSYLQPADQFFFRFNKKNTGSDEEKFI